MRRFNSRVAMLLVLAMSLTAAPISSYGAQKKEKKKKSKEAVAVSPPAVWRDPGRVEDLDFAAGPGGAKKTPRPPFTFVEEDTGGTNAKVKVQDAAGRTWGVKWGSEVHAEVFASRLAWAAGYFVEPSYFVKAGRIQGATHLHRAKKYVESDGRFTNARFELKEKGITKQTDKQSWRWDQNPFVGKKELNGLKIVIMLTSNWDPKDQRDDESNTAIHTVKATGDVKYVFTDWGATMGKWGGFMSREKWDCDGYSSQTRKFIEGTKRGVVEFGYEGKRKSEMREGITVNDVSWLLRYLGRITDAQFRAGLKASGATEGEVSCFTSALRDRINKLKDVAAGR